MPVLKNRRHELFAVQIAVHGKKNGEAYMACGFNPKNKTVAEAAAGRLMMMPTVQARIAELTSRATEKALNKITVTKAWLIEQAVELFRDAKAANNHAAAATVLKLLGQEFKTFVERRNITVRNLGDMDEDELKSLLDEFDGMEPGDETEAGASRPN